MGISIGMVGLGAFGSSFVPLFKSHPLVDRIALCDRVPERIREFAEKDSLQDKFDPSDCYDSLDALLKSDIQAVVIITQHWLHGHQAIQAMKAGKHVYAAVPLLSVYEGDEILDVCSRVVTTVQETGMHFMYGETTYYRPEAMFCRRKAAEGAFGEFVYAEGEYFHDYSHGLKQVSERRMGSIAGQEFREAMIKKYGKMPSAGPMHYPTHSTCGPICTMNAHMKRVWCLPQLALDEARKGTIVNETAMFEMSNGATCRISEYRQIGFGGRETFRVYGTEGSFEHKTWHEKNSSTPLTEDEMRDPLPTEVVEAFTGWRAHASANAGKLSEQERKDFLGGHGGSHAYLVHEFCDAIANDRRPAITAWDAARYTAAGVMAHKSAIAGGEVLDVPDWGDPPPAD